MCTGHYVYKYVYDGEIIYIGKSDVPDLRARLYQHGRKGDNIAEEAWDMINHSNIYYIELENAVMSDCVESELIRRYMPRLNKAKKSQWSGLPFAEPVWKPIQFFGLDDNDIYQAYDKAFARNKFLTRTIDKLEEEVKALRQTLTEKEARIKMLTKTLESTREPTPLLEDGAPTGKSLDEVIALYRNGEKNLDYVSYAFDAKDKINCVKRVYTTGPDYSLLRFEFEQTGTTYVSGFLYANPNQLTMTNQNVVRCWTNRGTNIYYPIAEANKHIKWENET